MTEKRVETCRPNNIQFIVYIYIIIVLLTDNVCIYAVCHIHNFLRSHI